MKTRLCELCKEEASLYCLSDSAFLCLDCDSKVHGANFLVARHIRRIICSKCKEFDGNFISGNKIQFYKPICLSCSSDSDEENLDSSSSSSACISTIESLNSSDIKTKKIRFDLNKPAISDSDDSGDQSSFQGNVSVEEVPDKTVREKTEKSNGIAEGIFVNWIRRLGYNSNSHVLLQRASYALSVCLEKMTFLPFKVALASSFWFSLKYSRGRSMSTCQNLKRVEEICGVTAKLIVLIESKICRTLNLNRRSNKIMDTEEGWAEFSGR